MFINCELRKAFIFNYYISYYYNNHKIIIIYRLKLLLANN